MTKTLFLYTLFPFMILLTSRLFDRFDWPDGVLIWYENKLQESIKQAG